MSFARVDTEQRAAEGAVDRLAYSVREAARLAGVSRTFLYGEIAAGRLSALKAGGRTLIARASLVAWLEQLRAWR